jgi:cysteine synthase A
MVCAVKGYPFVAIMSDSFSVERRKLMRIRRKVILTPAAERGSGMVKKAEEMAKKPLVPRAAVRVRHPVPPQHHGPESCRLRRKRLDWWVTGYGTYGP